MSVELVSKYLANAEAIVSASEKSGIPLHIVCAIVEQESNGRNVYGKDVGGVFYVPISEGFIEVTEENFVEFEKRVEAGEKSNGVGLTQITWHTLFGDARDKGYRLWIPEDNVLYGLHLLSGFLNDDYSLENLAVAASRYNSGKEDGSINWYGEQVVVKATHWKSLIDNPPKKFDKISHTVVKGDTFWRISKTYTVDILKLMGANPEVDPMNMEVGSEIVIPIESYTVQGGDSVWKISRLTGTPIARIGELNAFDPYSDDIYPGQILRVA